jgi:serine/threonine protein kinase/tetratricopeptide (TPR) repeat protein
MRKDIERPLLVGKMDRDRWRAANNIFHAALELPAGERENYVSVESHGDEILVANVMRLLRADSEAGSYLETPMIPDQFFDSTPIPFQSGDVLKNRFRIVRHVGQGGMGHVFEAFDLDLRVRVALKVIRPEIAGNHGALEYFRREVCTARTITHTNVCRTYDIDKGSITSGDPSAQEFCFLTMEFLAGDTLAELIKREGRLSIADALYLARQIASGLDSAHSVGVIHRDIKPANIMLVTATALDSARRVAIMDFGLARPLNSSDGGTSLSHGAVVGTLAYMAPEQLSSGETVSPATDIYAFGLVLFEMLTGARAFPSANLLSGITQRIAGPPPSPRSLVPQLPEVWETVIQRCLHLSASERFHSAGQVIEALDDSVISRAAAPSPSYLHAPPSRLRASTATIPSDGARPFRHKLLLASSILFASVALLVIGFRLYESRAESEVEPGALVYLSPVENQTGEHSLDNLTELVRAGLSQSAQINLLDQSRVGDILERMTKPPDTLIDPPVAREIALRTGAVRVIFASVTRSAGRYELKIDIQQLDATGPFHIRNDWPKSFQWTAFGSTTSGGAIPQELLHAVRDASDWIRLKVGESRNDIARLDAPPEDVTTGNWQALADYSLAERLASTGKRQDAVSALRTAIEEDPGFALAYARLGDILVSLNQVDEGYHAYLNALQEADRSRLSLRERARIKGIYAQDTGDFQVSEDAFREYSLYYEHDYLGWFYRALPLSMLGHTTAAIEVLKRAHQEDSQKIGPVFMLVRQNLLLGDIERARRWADELRAMHEEEAGQHADGIIAFVESDYSEASKTFRELAKSAKPPFHSVGIEYLADLDAEEDNYPEAIELLGRSIADNPENASRYLDRAYANGMAGNFTNCAEDAEAALSRDKSPYTLVAASEMLGQVLPKARGSQAVRLKVVLDSLGLDLPRDDFGTISKIARFRVRGEMRLAAGDPIAALDQFRKADKLEPPLAGRDYLGRALEASAEYEKNANARAKLRNEAMSAYSSLALHPAAVWQLPLRFPPGFYSQQLSAWLRLARLLGRHDDQFRSSQAALLKLHPFLASSQSLSIKSSARSSAPTHN